MIDQEESVEEFWKRLKANPYKALWAWGHCFVYCSEIGEIQVIEGPLLNDRGFRQRVTKESEHGI